MLTAVMSSVGKSFRRTLQALCFAFPFETAYFWTVHLCLLCCVTTCVQRLEEVYVEMEPGDALFFHSLLLHKSNQNSSPNRRWAFLCAYNKADNDPLIKHHHPQYTPLRKASTVSSNSWHFCDLKRKLINDA